MKTNEVKIETAKQLGLEPSSLDYITDQLLEELNDAQEEKETDQVELEESGELLVGIYCNSITYDPGTGGYIRYKRGEKGTPNYGCGTNLRKKLPKQGTTVYPKGGCSGGRKHYLVTW